MAFYVARDPFARGSYKRMSVTNTGRTAHVRDCASCGQKPRVLYVYEWESDERRRPLNAKMGKVFCNLNCFKTYHP